MNNKQHDSFEEATREILCENEAYTKGLYKRYKTKFVSWFMKQYRLNNQEALEVYHQAFLILYFQIKNEKLTSLNSTLETYLFGIGKKLMLRDQSGKKNFSELAEVDLVMANHYEEEKEELVHKKMQVRQILKQVAEPCKSILTMYYFREFSLESIATRLGYKNSGTVKKKKSLCLKHVREQLSAKQY